MVLIFRSGEEGEFVTTWSGTVSPTLGWNDISLDEPYVRSGTGPLQVQYCFDNCEGTSSFKVLNTQIKNSNQYQGEDDDHGCLLDDSYNE